MVVMCHAVLPSTECVGQQNGHYRQMAIMAECGPVPFWSRHISLVVIRLWPCCIHHGLCVPAASAIAAMEAMTASYALLVAPKKEISYRIIIVDY